MKLFLSILVLVVSAMSQTMNYNGYGDTAWIGGLTGSATVFNSKAFNLSQFENCRAIMCLNDTVRAGFASDSVKVIWGYQTGSIQYNGRNKSVGNKGDSASVCTLWNAKMCLDTFDITRTAKLIPPTFMVDSTGSDNTSGLWIDTTQITGFACQTVNYAPRWNILIRYWAKGLSGNIAVTPLKAMLTHLRRMGQNVRNY